MALIGDTWLSAPMIPRLCAITGCHRTTVLRWLQKRALPPAAARLLELVLSGRLQRIHAAWDGWRLDPLTGELVTPTGARLQAPDIISLPLRYQEIAALRRRLAELADVQAVDLEARREWSDARDRLLGALVDLDLLDPARDSQFSRGHYSARGAGALRSLPQKKIAVALIRAAPAAENSKPHGRSK